MEGYRQILIYFLGLFINNGVSFGRHPAEVRDPVLRSAKLVSFGIIITQVDTVGVNWIPPSGGMTTLTKP